MALATIVKRSVMSLGGGVKMEWAKTSTDVANGDTIVSQMNTVAFAMPFAVSDDSGDVSAAVSGRTITIHDPSGSGAILVLAFGT